MKLIRLLCIFSIILLSSCATHYGALSGNAVITNKNFKIVGIVAGKSYSSAVFGIGGLSDDALVFKAKQDIYSNYPLEEGQALTNLTVDFNHSNYLVYKRTEVIVTAEIVDFNVLNNDDYENDVAPNNYSVTASNGFFDGEEIFLMKKIEVPHKDDSSKTVKKEIYESGYITKLGLSECSVLFANVESETIDTLVVAYDKLYKLRGHISVNNIQYSVGHVGYYSPTEESFVQEKVSPNQEAKILGISSKYVLLYFISDKSYRRVKR